MEIMLTNPPLSPGKPDLRIIKLEPRAPGPIVKMPCKQPLAQPVMPVEPLDRRQVRLRWD
jgi:hypothetical protein